MNIFKTNKITCATLKINTIQGIMILEIIAAWTKLCFINPPWKVPFRIYLSRWGILISRWPSNSKNKLQIKQITLTTIIRKETRTTDCRVGARALLWHEKDLRKHPFVHRRLQDAASVPGLSTGLQEYFSHVYLLCGCQFISHFL